MERLLHYVWKYKLYASTPLTTTEGLPTSVIDPGIQRYGPEAWRSTKKLPIGCCIIMIQIRHMTPLSCM